MSREAFADFLNEPQSALAKQRLLLWSMSVLGNSLLQFDT